MKIGDKVRLVHGKESGVITRIIGNQQVEVEIEDGFRIPVARNEVTVISSEENLLTGKKIILSEAPEPTSVKTLSGTIQIAFQAFNDRTHKILLINERNCSILFSCYKKTKQRTELIQSGKLDKGAVLTLDEWTIQEFSNWPSLQFQFIYLLPVIEKMVPPFSADILVKAEKFYKNKKLHPLLKAEAHFWPIDSDLKLTDKHIQELTTALNDSLPSDSLNAIQEPDHEIDLHIEKLEDDWQHLTASQIMQIQLRTFEKNLDNAIACGMDEIIFIHGIGNNVLKNEIHKRLSKEKRIDFFKDAKKEQFGYGATLVKLK
jgi:hypothetical protein